MKQQATAMALASFAADSLALGAHWIYDTDEIDRRIGRVDSLRSPLPDSYHPTKKKGEFTHYGDQALILLEHLAETGEFSSTRFATAWKTRLTDYHGYIDKASATTLDNMAGAEFIAKTAWAVLHGSSPIAALESILKEGVADIDLDNRIRNSLDSAGKDTGTMIKQFGQMCGIAAALPGVVHLIISYENDLKTALIENVMAGGDSAARGLVVGMILGAHLGRQAIPEEWLAEMVQCSHIEALISSRENTR